MLYIYHLYDINIVVLNSTWHIPYRMSSFTRAWLLYSHWRMEAPRMCVPVHAQWKKKVVRCPKLVSFVCVCVRVCAQAHVCMSKFQCTQALHCSWGNPTLEFSMTTIHLQPVHDLVCKCVLVCVCVYVVCDLGWGHQLWCGCGRQSISNSWQ